MARYDYKCRACNDRFELTRDIKSRDDSATCPKCGSGDVIRAFGATGRRNRRRSKRSEMPLNVGRPTEPAGLILPSHQAGKGHVENFSAAGFPIGVAAYGGEHELKNIRTLGTKKGVYFENADINIEDLEVD